MKSDQDQSHGSKKPRKGLFNFGDHSNQSKERQEQRRSPKQIASPKSGRHQKSSTPPETPRSSSSTFRSHLSMSPTKTPASVSINTTNQDSKSKVEPSPLFNFRFGSQSKTTTKSKTKTTSSPSLPTEIKSKSSVSRRQRRQKGKTPQSLPLTSAENTIVKRSPKKIELPPPLPRVKTNPTAKNQRKPRKKPPSFFTYIFRLLILGIGIGAVLGTILSIFDSNYNLFIGELSSPQEQTQQRKTKELKPPVLDKEIIPLKEQLKTVTDQYPELNAGIFLIDLDNKSYLDSQGTNIFSAASTIKIPILMAFFEDVDQGKVRLDENLVMEQELVGGGSGDMQYQKVGTTFSALVTATKMIVISDNTATNMLIKRLGGKEELNKRFQEWGLTNTVINNYLPDLEGTNTTSPKDLVNMLALINQGDILSLKSRDRVLEIMRQTKTRTLLPEGLGDGASIAHKTGDIGKVLGDAGVVDMPNGKRYLVSVLVERPHNDIRGRTIIQEISRTIYDYFLTHPDQPTPLPTPLPNPTTSG